MNKLRFIFGFFCFCSGLSAYAQQHVHTVLYVNTGNSALDTSSKKALADTVAALNAGAPSGTSYRLDEVDTFPMAEYYRDHPLSDPAGADVSSIVLVSHAVEVNGVITGNLQDTTEDATRRPRSTRNSSDLITAPLVTHLTHANWGGI